MTEGIREHLVVQVVTDNTSAYRTAKNMLMEKNKHLYWAPCITHYTDLVLEKLNEFPQHQNALIKAKKNIPNSFTIILGVIFDEKFF